MKIYYTKHPEKWQSYYVKNGDRIRANARRRYAENRERYLEYARKYRENNPDLVLQRTHDWRERNRKHTREYAKSWAKENPERAKDGRDRRRARMANAPIVQPVDRLAIWKNHGGKCHICLGRVSQANFHLDHLVPLSRGGDHAGYNLAPAHPRCNMSRGAGRLPAQLKLVA